VRHGTINRGAQNYTYAQWDGWIVASPREKVAHTEGRAREREESAAHLLLLPASPTCCLSLSSLGCVPDYF
jgi:hypothetical protein